MTTKKEHPYPAISLLGEIGPGIITSILEATGRFQLIHAEGLYLKFYDSDMDVSRLIPANTNLTNLMDWIADLYTREGIGVGRDRAQKEIRKALGLD